MMNFNKKMTLFVLATLMLGATSLFRANAQSTVTKSKLDTKEKERIIKVKNANMYFDASEVVPHNDEVVISGPLFKNNGKPVGWYAHDGKTLKNRVSPSTGGGNFSGQNAFFIQYKDGSYDIVPYEEATDTHFDDVEFGFQNGRQLLFKENGKTINPHNRNSPNRYDRIGMGYIESTNEIVIIQKEDCTYYELAKAFEDEGATEAIYLDGANIFSLDDMVKYEQGTTPKNALKIHFKG